MNDNKQSFQADGIMEKGYGFIPKLIMKDKELTIEAKAIYAYLSSYTGAGNTAYPSISLMCGDLGISEARFYKHRKVLVEKGYVVITKQRSEGGWDNNIYTLPFKPYPQNLSTQNLSTQNLSTQNLSTKSNSIKSNSIKSNSSSGDDDNNPLIDEDFKNLINLFVNSGFGSNIAYIRDEMNGLLEDYEANWIEDAMKEAIDNNVRKLSYVKGILRDWDTKGKNNRQYKQEVEKSTNSWKVDAT